MDLRHAIAALAWAQLSFIFVNVVWVEANEGKGERSIVAPRVRKAQCRAVVDEVRPVFSNVFARMQSGGSSFARLGEDPNVWPVLLHQTPIRLESVAFEESWRLPTGKVK